MSRPIRTRNFNKHESFSSKVILALIAALGLIIVAIIGYVATIKSASLPIEATQTAEAKQTSIALTSQDVFTSTPETSAPIATTTELLSSTLSPETPPYPNGYIRFDDLANGIVEFVTGTANFQKSVNNETLCFNNNPDNSASGYLLTVRPKNPTARFDGVHIGLRIDVIEGNWASVGFITLWGNAESGVKLGVYYIGPGPAANGVDGEISVVTTTFGTGGTETSEVFQIHPDLIAPFTLRIEKSGGTVNLYYNNSDIPYAVRSLPSAEMYGTYAQLEGNVSTNTDLSACWSDLGVLYK